MRGEVGMAMMMVSVSTKPTTTAGPVWRKREVRGKFMIMWREQVGGIGDGTFGRERRYLIRMDEGRVA